MKLRSVISVRTAPAVLTGLMLARVLTGCSALRLNYARPAIETYSIESEFINIEINCPDCEIELLPTKTDKGRNVTATVVYRGNDETKHSVGVENGTLKIGHEKSGKGGIVIYSDKDEEIAVYLPEKEYLTLSIQSNSGSIIVPEDFSFENVSLQTVSGQIQSSAEVGRTLLAQSASGSMRIEGTSTEYLETYSKNGNVEILNVSGNSAWAETTSGNIMLRQAVFSDELNIETTSGSVRFDDSDALIINVKTKSGNIKGTLLSKKVYQVSSESGSVSLPAMSDNEITGGDGRDTYYGTCTIDTGSGTVDIKTK